MPVVRHDFKEEEWEVARDSANSGQGSQRSQVKKFQ